MRKFNGLFLVVTMIFLLAACGTDENGEEDPPSLEASLSVDDASIDEFFSVSTFDIQDIHLTYEDESGETITIILDESMVTSEIPNTPGEHSISVTYQNLETTFDVVLVNQVEYQLQMLYSMGVSEGLIDADSYEEWLNSITGQDGEDGVDGEDGEDGEDGRSIESLDIIDRELFVTFDDEAVVSLGIIVPEDPRSIESTDLSDSQLTITYDDGTEDSFVLNLPNESETVTNTRMTNDGYLEVTYASGSSEILGRVRANEVEFDVTDDVLRWRYENEDTWNDLSQLSDWMQDDEYVTVTLKYLDDYVYDEFQIRRGEAFVKDAPSMLGFMFNGWAADRDGSERVDASTPVYEDMTLYAHFVPDETHQHMHYHAEIPPYLPIDSQAGYASFDATNYHASSTLIIPNKVMNEAGNWVPLSVIEAEAFKDLSSIETVHVMSEDHIEFEASVFERTINLETFIFEYPQDLGVVLHERVFKDTKSLEDMVFPTNTSLGYRRFISDEEAVTVEWADFVEGELRVLLSDDTSQNLGITEDEIETWQEDYDSVVSSLEGDQFIITLTNEGEEPIVKTYTIEGLQEAGTKTFYADKLFQNSGIRSFVIEGEYGIFENINNALINEIPYRAFEGAQNLETFRVPSPNADIGLIEDSTLMIWREIGDYAFAGTTSLLEFNFDRYTSLGAYAFKDSGITEANFHLDPFSREGVFRHIDLSNAAYAFKGAHVEVVSFADGQEFIPEGFFMNTQFLDTIEIPIETLSGGFDADASASLTRFEARAFKNSNLSEIDFPTRGRDTLTFEDITYFGEESLAGTQFETIEISENATVKEGAFRGIETLETFIWNSTGDALPSYLLADTPNLQAVTLPDRTLELGEGFLYNSGIETFYVPGALRGIGAEAFKGSNISNIEFGAMDNYLVDDGEASMLETIGESAFEDTSNLESIVLPFVFHPQDRPHILEVGPSAFKNSGLKSFESLHDHTTFDQNAFEAARDLETFIWTGNAEKIANQMFAGATSLETLTFPDTIEEIGQAAFYNTSLTTFDLPSSIVEIGPRAFRNTHLETFNFPEDTALTHIGSNAFQGVEAELTIVFPNTLESLGRGVFQESNVISVDFNEAPIESIPQATFTSAEMLESVRLSKQTEVIETGAFRNTDALETFEVGPEENPIDRNISFTLPTEHSLTTIKQGAFINSGIEHLELPSSVEVIESSVFRTSALQSIVLSEALHTLESNAFFGAQNLETVVFSGSELTTLNSGTFAHTLSLDALTLPPSIETIESDAFKDAHLEFLRLSPVHVGDLETIIGDLDTLKELRFTPSQSVPDDMTTFPAVFELNDTIEVVGVPSGITELAPSAFNGAYALRRVFLPSTLESISEAAFAFTHDLELVTAGTSLTSIERDAFFSSGIQSFELPDGVEFIGRHAFRNTENLKALNHDPEASALQTIESGAFRGSGLESFIIPDATLTIEERAFSETDALSEITLPNTLEHLGPYLFEASGVNTVHYELMNKSLPEGFFYNAANLEHVEFAEDLEIERFAPYAFSGTESLIEFTLPESLIETGEASFKNHPTLERLYLNANLETVSDSTFEGASALFEVDVPNHDDGDEHALKHIGQKAFKDTVSLSFFFVGENLETIGDHAFENSNFNPAPANLPSSLRYVGNYAFKGSNITEFTVSENLVTIGNSAFEASTLDTLNFTQTHNVYPDSEAVTLENGLVIGEGAFRNTQIETFALPYYVVMINESAFRDNDLLQSVDTTNADNLFVINAHAFRNTQALSEFDLPSSLRYLEAFAFAQTGPFETFTIPELQDDPYTDGRISQLGEGILYDSAVENVVVRGGFEDIPAYAFANMNHFESIEFIRPSLIKTIGEAAFYNTENLVDLPSFESLSTIGDRAFEGTQIDTFSFSNTLALIGKQAFKNTSLTEVDFTLEMEDDAEISDALIIEAEAFYGTNFTTFEAPKTLKSIGNNAFAQSDLEVVFLTSETELVTLPETFRHLNDRSDPFRDSNLLGVIVEESVYHLYEQDRTWSPYFDIIEFE